MEQSKIIDNAINSADLANAMSTAKSDLISTLNDQIVYEIESLDRLETLALNLVDPNSRIVIETIPIEPSGKYVKVLWCFLRKKTYEQYKIDSYVTAFVCRRTNVVFLDFYTNEKMQKLLVDNLKFQLYKFLEYLEKLDIKNKSSIRKAIDFIVEKELNTIIKEKIMSQAFEEALNEVLGKLQTEVLVGGAVGATFIILVVNGVISARWSFLAVPLAIILITYSAVNFRSSLAKKVAKKVADTVSTDLFPKINMDMAKVLAKTIIREIRSRLKDAGIDIE